MYLLSRTMLGFVIYFKRFYNNVFSTKKFHKEKLAELSKADVFSIWKRKNENKYIYPQLFLTRKSWTMRLQNYLFVFYLFTYLMWNFNLLWNRSLSDIRYRVFFVPKNQIELTRHQVRWSFSSRRQFSPDGHAIKSCTFKWARCQAVLVSRSQHYKWWWHTYDFFDLQKHSKIVPHDNYNNYHNGK